MLYGEIITTVETDGKEMLDWFLPQPRSLHWEMVEQECGLDRLVSLIADGEVELDLPHGYRLYFAGDIDTSEYKNTDRDMFRLEKVSTAADPRQMELAAAAVDCDCDIPAFGYICDSCEIPEDADCGSDAEEQQQGNSGGNWSCDYCGREGDARLRQMECLIPDCEICYCGHCGWMGDTLDNHPDCGV